MRAIPSRLPGPVDPLIDLAGTLRETHRLRLTRSEEIATLLRAPRDAGKPLCSVPVDQTDRLAR